MEIDVRSAQWNHTFSEIVKISFPDQCRPGNIGNIDVDTLNLENTYLTPIRLKNHYSYSSTYVNPLRGISIKVENPSTYKTHLKAAVYAKGGFFDTEKLQKKVEELQPLAQRLREEKVLGDDFIYKLRESYRSKVAQINVDRSGLSPRFYVKLNSYSKEEITHILEVLREQKLL